MSEGNVKATRRPVKTSVQPGPCAQRAICPFLSSGGDGASLCLANSAVPKDLSAVAVDRLCSRLQHVTCASFIRGDPKVKRMAASNWQRRTPRNPVVSSTPPAQTLARGSAIQPAILLSAFRDPSVVPATARGSEDAKRTTVQTSAAETHVSQSASPEGSLSPDLSQAAVVTEVPALETTHSTIIETEVVLSEEPVREAEIPPQVPQDIETPDDSDYTPAHPEPALLNASPPPFAHPLEANREGTCAGFELQNTIVSVPRLVLVPRITHAAKPSSQSDAGASDGDPYSTSPTRERQVMTLPVKVSIRVIGNSYPSVERVSRRMRGRIKREVCRLSKQGWKPDEPTDYLWLYHNERFASSFTPGVFSRYQVHSVTLRFQRCSL